MGRAEYELLVPPQALTQSLRERRCALTQTLLQPSECVVSALALPALYAGTPLSPREERTLHGVLRTTAAVLAALSRTDDADLVRAVQLLWVKVLQRGDPTDTGRDTTYREWLLHRYLYFFWDDLSWTPGTERLLLDDLFVPQDSDTWRDRDPFFERIGRMAAQGAPVDVIARKGTTLHPVEVKYGAADDRAVGQLLRYFEFYRTLCHRRDHLCDLRRVVPVLIAKDFPVEAWVSLPTSFRELLVVLFYGFENDVLTVRDGKKALQLQLRSRHSPHHF